jgi:MtaA/CmuA family methyltransferase
MNGHERIVAMFAGRPVDRVPLMPITMMFAGDHAGIRYGEYAADYRRLAEAQIAIARDYDFDYVSAISDPAREAADCGADIEYFDNQPPAINETHARLDDKRVLDRLEIPDLSAEGRMLDRVRGVRLLKDLAGGEKLVEGWIEGPCAESADLRGINTLMLDFYDDPDFVRRLFDFVLEMGLRFAKAQVDAGAQLIGVGDAAASLIGPQLYYDFVWPYEKKLVEGLHAMGAAVRLHICGNTSKILEGMGRLGCEMVDIDFLVPIADARRAMGPNQVLLGNLDPVRVIRDGTPESITAAVAECHRQAGPRYIVGAGCEIPRGTPPDNLLALTRYAQTHQP